MSLLPKPVKTSDAVVLRTWPTGETSVIASLLTADFGYVRIIAKSARRPHSVLRSLVQPGRLANLEFSLVPDRELQYLRAGSLLLDPLAEAASLEKSVFLLAAVELVDRCRPSGAAEGRLFALCHDYLRMLSCSACASEACLLYAFELALLSLQGVAPALQSCSVCGREVPAGAEAGLRFEPASGGVVCQSCAPGEVNGHGRVLAAEVLQALRVLAIWPAGIDDVAAPRWVRRQVGILLHHFLGFHLPGYRLPAALDLLRSGSTAGRPEAEAEAAGEERQP